MIIERREERRERGQRQIDVEGVLGGGKKVLETLIYRLGLRLKELVKAVESSDPGAAKKALIGLSEAQTPDEKVKVVGNLLSTAKLSPKVSASVSKIAADHQRLQALLIEASVAGWQGGDLEKPRPPRIVRASRKLDRDVKELQSLPESGPFLKAVDLIYNDIQLLTREIARRGYKFSDVSSDLLVGRSPVGELVTFAPVATAQPQPPAPQGGGTTVAVPTGKRGTTVAVPTEGREPHPPPEYPENKKKPEWKFENHVCVYRCNDFSSEIYKICRATAYYGWVHIDPIDNGASCGGGDKFVWQTDWPPQSMAAATSADAQACFNKVPSARDIKACERLKKAGNLAAKLMLDHPALWGLLQNFPGNITDPLGWGSTVSQGRDEKGHFFNYTSGISFAFSNPDGTSGYYDAMLRPDGTIKQDYTHTEHPDGSSVDYTRTFARNGTMAGERTITHNKDGSSTLVEHNAFFLDANDNIIAKDGRIRTLKYDSKGTLVEGRENCPDGGCAVLDKDGKVIGTLRAGAENIFDSQTKRWQWKEGSLMDESSLTSGPGGVTIHVSAVRDLRSGKIIDGTVTTKGRDFSIEETYAGGVITNRTTTTISWGQTTVLKEEFHRELDEKGRVIAEHITKEFAVLDPKTGEPLKGPKGHSYKEIYELTYDEKGRATGTIKREDVANKKIQTQEVGADGRMTAKDIPTTEVTSRTVTYKNGKVDGTEIKTHTYNGDTTDKDAMLSWSKVQLDAKGKVVSGTTYYVRLTSQSDGSAIYPGSEIDYDPKTGKWVWAEGSKQDYTGIVRQIESRKDLTRTATLIGYVDLHTGESHVKTDAKEVAIIRDKKTGKQVETQTTISHFDEKGKFQGGTITHDYDRAQIELYIGSNNKVIGGRRMGQKGADHPDIPGLKYGADSEATLEVESGQAKWKWSKNSDFVVGAPEALKVPVKTQDGKIAFKTYSEGTHLDVNTLAPKEGIEILKDAQGRTIGSSVISGRTYDPASGLPMGGSVVEKDANGKEVGKKEWNYLITVGADGRPVYSGATTVTGPDGKVRYEESNLTLVIGAPAPLLAFYNAVAGQIKMAYKGSQGMAAIFNSMFAGLQATAEWLNPNVAKILSGTKTSRSADGTSSSLIYSNGVIVDTVLRAPAGSAVTKDSDPNLYRLLQMLGVPEGSTAKTELEFKGGKWRGVVQVGGRMEIPGFLSSEKGGTIDLAKMLPSNGSVTNRKEEVVKDENGREVIKDGKAVTKVTTVVLNFKEGEMAGGVQTTVDEYRGKTETISFDGRNQATSHSIEYKKTLTEKVPGAYGMPEAEVEYAAGSKMVDGKWTADSHMTVKSDGGYSVLGPDGRFYVYSKDSVVNLETMLPQDGKMEVRIGDQLVMRTTFENGNRKADELFKDGVASGKNVYQVVERSDADHKYRTEMVTRLDAQGKEVGNIEKIEIDGLLRTTTERSHADQIATVTDWKYDNKDRPGEVTGFTRTSNDNRLERGSYKDGLLEKVDHVGNASQFSPGQVTSTDYYDYHGNKNLASITTKDAQGKTLASRAWNEYGDLKKLQVGDIELEVQNRNEDGTYRVQMSQLNKDGAKTGIAVKNLDAKMQEDPFGSWDKSKAVEVYDAKTAQWVLPTEENTKIKLGEGLGELSGTMHRAFAGYTRKELLDNKTFAGVDGFTYGFDWTDSISGRQHFSDTPAYRTKKEYWFMNASGVIAKSNEPPPGGEVVRTKDVYETVGRVGVDKPMVSREAEQYANKDFNIKETRVELKDRNNPDAGVIKTQSQLNYDYQSNMTTLSIGNNYQFYAFAGDLKNIRPGETFWGAIKTTVDGKSEVTHIAIGYENIEGSDAKHLVIRKADEEGGTLGDVVKALPPGGFGLGGLAHAFDADMAATEKAQWNEMSWAGKAWSKGSEFVGEGFEVLSSPVKMTAGLLMMGLSPLAGGGMDEMAAMGQQWYSTSKPMEWIGRIAASAVAGTPISHEEWQKAVLDTSMGIVSQASFENIVMDKAARQARSMGQDSRYMTVDELKGVWGGMGFVDNLNWGGAEMRSHGAVLGTIGTVGQALGIADYTAAEMYVGGKGIGLVGKGLGMGLEAAGMARSGMAVGETVAQYGTSVFMSPEFVKGQLESFQNPFASGWDKSIGVIGTLAGMGLVARGSKVEEQLKGAKEIDPNARAAYGGLGLKGNVEGAGGWEAFKGTVGDMAKGSAVFGLQLGAGAGLDALGMPGGHIAGALGVDVVHHRYEALKEAGKVEELEGERNLQLARLEAPRQRMEIAMGKPYERPLTQMEQQAQDSLIRDHGYAPKEAADIVRLAPEGMSPRELLGEVGKMREAGKGPQDIISEMGSRGPPREPGLPAQQASLQLDSKWQGAADVLVGRGYDPKAVDAWINAARDMGKSPKDFLRDMATAREAGKSEATISRAFGLREPTPTEPTRSTLPLEAAVKSGAKKGMSSKAISRALGMKELPEVEASFELAPERLSYQDAREYGEALGIKPEATEKIINAAKAKGLEPAQIGEVLRRVAERGEQVDFVVYEIEKTSKFEKPAEAAGAPSASEIAFRRGLPAAAGAPEGPSGVGPPTAGAANKAMEAERVRFRQAMREQGKEMGMERGREALYPVNPRAEGAYRSSVSRPKPEMAGELGVSETAQIAQQGRSKTCTIEALAAQLDAAGTRNRNGSRVTARDILNLAEREFGKDFREMIERGGLSPTDELAFRRAVSLEYDVSFEVVSADKILDNVVNGRGVSVGYQFADGGHQVFVDRLGFGTDGNHYVEFLDPVTGERHYATAEEFVQMAGDKGGFVLDATRGLTPEGRLAAQTQVDRFKETWRAEAALREGAKRAERGAAPGMPLALGLGRAYEESVKAGGEGRLEAWIDPETSRVGFGKEGRPKGAHSVELEAYKIGEDVILKTPRTRELAKLPEGARKALENNLKGLSENLGIKEVYREYKDQHGLTEQDLAQAYELARTMREAGLRNEPFVDRIFYDSVRQDVAYSGIKLRIADFEVKPGMTEAEIASGRKAILEGFLESIKDPAIAGDVDFKIGMFMKAMTGGNAGKFITVYTKNPRTGLELARRLDRAMAERSLKSGAKAPEDMAFGESGMVSWRLGGFTDYFFEVPEGAGTRRVPDSRQRPIENLLAGKEIEGIGPWIENAKKSPQYQEHVARGGEALPAWEAEETVVFTKGKAQAAGVEGKPSGVEPPEGFRRGGAERGAAPFRSPEEIAFDKLQEIVSGREIAKLTKGEARSALESLRNDPEFMERGAIADSVPGVLRDLAVQSGEWPGRVTTKEAFRDLMRREYFERTELARGEAQRGAAPMRSPEEIAFGKVREVLGGREIARMTKEEARASLERLKGDSDFMERGAIADSVPGVLRDLAVRAGEWPGKRTTKDAFRDQLRREYFEKEKFVRGAAERGSVDILPEDRELSKDVEASEGRAAFVRTSAKEIPGRPNEDAVNLNADKRFIIAADGLGGLAAGDVASRIAKETITRELESRITPKTTPEQAEAILESAMHKANRAIYDHSLKHPETEGMATTASVGVVVKDPMTGKDVLVTANVGDSGVFVRRADGKLEAASHEESVAAEMQEKVLGALKKSGVDVGRVERNGRIEPEDFQKAKTALEELARSTDDPFTAKLIKGAMAGGKGLDLAIYEIHPRRNIVGNSLGRDENLGFGDKNLVRTEVASGDSVFAVTDGVLDNLGMARMQEIVRGTKTPAELMGKLASESERIALEPKDKMEKLYSKPDDISGAALLIGEGGKPAVAAKEVSAKPWTPKERQALIDLSARRGIASETARKWVDQGTESGMSFEDVHALVKGGLEGGMSPERISQALGIKGGPGPEVGALFARGPPERGQGPQAVGELLRGLERESPQLKEKLERKLYTDFETEAHNLRYLRENAQRLVQEKSEVIHFNLDLKSINDSYGHGAGDAVLKAVGEFLRSEFSADGKPVSFEFMRGRGGNFYLLTREGPQGAARLAEALRRAAPSEIARRPSEIDPRARVPEDRVNVRLGLSEIAREAGKPDSRILEETLRRAEGNPLRKSSSASLRWAVREGRAPYSFKELLEQVKDPDLRSRLEREVYRDATGALNREWLSDNIESVLQGSQALGAIDVNYLGALNRVYGERAIDGLIQRLVDFVHEKSAGKADLVRIGGDEFLLAIREMSEPEALKFSEDLRTSVEGAVANRGELPKPRPGDIEAALDYRPELKGDPQALRNLQEGRITISLGLVALPKEAGGLRGLQAQRAFSGIMDVADKALYAAKEKGRNRVELGRLPPDLLGKAGEGFQRGEARRGAILPERPRPEELKKNMRDATYILNETLKSNLYLKDMARTLGLSRIEFEFGPTPFEKGFSEMSRYDPKTKKVILSHALEILSPDALAKSVTGALIQASAERNARWTIGGSAEVALALGESAKNVNGEITREWAPGGYRSFELGEPKTPFEKTLREFRSLLASRDIMKVAPERLAVDEARFKDFARAHPDFVLEGREVTVAKLARAERYLEEAGKNKEAADRAVREKHRAVAKLEIRSGAEKLRLWEAWSLRRELKRATGELNRASEDKRRADLSLNWWKETVLEEKSSLEVLEKAKKDPALGSLKEPELASLLSSINDVIVTKRTEALEQRAEGFKRGKAQRGAAPSDEEKVLRNAETILSDVATVNEDLRDVMKDLEVSEVKVRFAERSFVLPRGRPAYYHDGKVFISPEVAELGPQAVAKIAAGALAHAYMEGKYEGFWDVYGPFQTKTMVESALGTSLAHSIAEEFGGRKQLMIREPQNAFERVYRDYSEILRKGDEAGLKRFIQESPELLEEARRLAESELTESEAVIKEARQHEESLAKEVGSLEARLDQAQARLKELKEGSRLSERLKTVLDSFKGLVRIGDLEAVRAKFEKAALDFFKAFPEALEARGLGKEISGFLEELEPNRMGLELVRSSRTLLEEMQNSRREALKGLEEHSQQPLEELSREKLQAIGKIVLNYLDRAMSSVEMGEVLKEQREGPPGGGPEGFRPGRAERGEAPSEEVLAPRERVEPRQSRSISRIEGDKRLVREAKDAGKNPSVQKELDSLIKGYLQGNDNPGIGTKHLTGDIWYLRGRGGARVFFRRSGDTIEILAKASKANEDRVIRIVEELWGPQGFRRGSAERGAPPGLETPPAAPAEPSTTGMYFESREEAARVLGGDPQKARVVRTLEGSQGKAVVIELGGKQWVRKWWPFNDIVVAAYAKERGIPREAAREDILRRNRQRMQNELFLWELVKERMSEDFEAVRDAVAVPDGAGGIYYLTRFESAFKPDKGRFKTDFTPSQRAKLAILSFVFGLTDVNAGNILFQDSGKGKPLLIDFEFVGGREPLTFDRAPISKPESGDVALLVYAQNRPYFDRLSRTEIDINLYLRELENWKANMQDPAFVDKIKDMMKGAQFSDQDIADYLKNIELNIQNFRQNIEPYIEQVNADIRGRKGVGQRP